MGNTINRSERARAKMGKQIILTILIFFLIGVLSAEPIVITPSEITIYAFPGETIQQNFTIKAEGNYAVFFNSSNPNATIVPDKLIVEEGESILILNITFAKDIPAGTITFEISASTDYPEKIIYSGGGGSGGTKTIYKDRNITKYKIIEVEKQQECEECLIEEEPIPDKEIEKEKSLFSKTIFFIFVLIICGLLVVYYLFLVISQKFKKHKINKDESIYFNRKS